MTSSRPQGPPSMSELLEQDKVWWSRHNRVLACTPLDEMELDHIKSLRAWLLRNADSIHYGVLSELQRSAAHVNGEAAQWEVDRELGALEGTDPEVWMRNTVLFEALTERLETVSIRYFSKTDLAVIMRLAKLALSAPPGTHTQDQLRQIERVRRKLAGTGGEATEQLEKTRA